MANLFKDFLKELLGAASSWPPSKKTVYSIIEKHVVSLVIHLLKVSGTFKTYLIAQIIEYSFDELVIPLLELGLRKGKLYYEIKKGKLTVRKINQARDENNRDDYNSGIDDILQD